MRDRNNRRGIPPSERALRSCVVQPRARRDICLHTHRVYDECRAHDNMRDLPIYLTEKGQELLNRSLTIKAVRAKVIWVYSDVRPVLFDPGRYSVDVEYFFKITLEAFQGVSEPEIIEGLCIADKSVVQYGAEGRIKRFESRHDPITDAPIISTTNNLPTISVQVADPLIIDTVITNGDCCPCCKPVFIIPKTINSFFDDELLIVNNGKHASVSLGVFSIISLERDVEVFVDEAGRAPRIKNCSLSEDNTNIYFDTLSFPENEFIPEV